MNTNRKGSNARRLAACSARALALLILMTAGCEIGEPTGAPFEDIPPRIVGGQPTHYAQFQGAVGLVIGGRSGAAQLCTGTLIDPELVLTAAHCVYLPQRGVDVLDTPHDVEIAGGSDILGLTKVSYSRAEEIIVHDRWNGIMEWGNIDLALILLEDPITDIEPYPIRKQTPSEGDEGMVVGYGMIDIEDVSSAGLHRMGESRVLQLEPPLMEIGNPAGTCQGDSGGPFFVETGGTWQLAGVVSFGTERECHFDEDTWTTVLSFEAGWLDENARALLGHALVNPDTSSASDLDSEAPTDSDQLDTTQSPRTDDDAAGGVESCQCSALGQARSLHLNASIIAAAALLLH